MIELTPDFRTRYRTAIRRARTERIRVIRLEDNLWYVARREKGHGRYLVRMFHQGEAVSAVCSNIYNQPCESTKKPGVACIHIAAAVEHGIRDGRRRQKREGKQAA